ncbi:MAG: GMC oxidoreductase, partial [Janthinobacterium lividum]
VSDIRALGDGECLRTDVCIVGAGPVGLTLAAELSRANVDTVLVESGGLEPDPWADSLNEFESTGAARVMDPTLSRNRILGGSSSTWSGRVAAFDEIDFLERAWVPGSGWPIPRSEVARFLDRTRPYLGVAITDNNEVALRDRILGPDAREFDPALLDDYIWSYSADSTRSRDFMRFGPRALAVGIPGARTILNATLTHVDTNVEGTEVTGLEVVGPDGLVRRVHARDTVLCAGGIENARIMLASDRIVRGGVGNGRDLVGRHLMDHPRGHVGAFAGPRAASAQRAFNSYRVRLDGSATTVTRGVALSRSVQEREQLLNCSAWLEGVVSSRDPFEALRRLARFQDPAGSAVDVVRGSLQLARGGVRVLKHRSPVRDLDTLHVTTMVEQVPDPDSRITLSGTKDELGVRRARIDWRLGDAEARTTRRMAQIMAAELQRVGLPRPDLLPMVTDPSQPFYFPDVAHPMGTTRMSADPRHGVVDSDCAVHGVSGLYCAGTSVFSTSGHANPTQTALALTIRLAERLVRERRA